MKIKEGASRWLFIILLFFIIIGLTAFWLLYQPNSFLELNVLDVGQGDAIFIQTPSGKTVLIDGGPDNKVIRRLSEELPFWQRQIDLVILTHPHDDHFQGLVEVLKRYQVTKLLITRVECFNPAYQEFLEVARSSKTQISLVDDLDKFVIDDINFTVLYPIAKVADKKYDNFNNSSIVLKLSYHDIDFLMMGDAEVVVEEELLSKSINVLESEVLKLGHHGADTSSDEDFLRAVNPKIALISVGEINSYGHPSPLITKRLDRLSIKQYLTKDLGTIKLQTDGKWLKVDETCLIANCPL